LAFFVDAFDTSLEVTLTGKRCVTNRVVANNGLYLITDDFINDISRYATLPHTWGAANEQVIFKDVVDDTGKSKAGCKKLLTLRLQNPAQQSVLQFGANDIWSYGLCVRNPLVSSNQSQTDTRL
jgi:hypothetical protein